jgi:RNA polymerase sigma-70 factor (ECF subfamily)
MQESPWGVGPGRANLDQISTEWSLIHDPASFIKRYAPAMERYLQALLKNPHDAEEVLQDFLVRVVQHGFLRVRQDRGRFRDYLKVAVRNAALNYLQRKPSARRCVTDLTRFPARPDAGDDADQDWLSQWRRCLLERTWRALKRHEERSAQNLCYTVLRLKADSPRTHSQALAARASARAGYPLRPEAFRKQLSRARRLFAEFLIQEVAQTLDYRDPERIAEELTELRLIDFVREFLPSGRRGALAPSRK